MSACLQIRRWEVYQHRFVELRVTLDKQLRLDYFRVHGYANIGARFDPAIVILRQDDKSISTDAGACRRIYIGTLPNAGIERSFVFAGELNFQQNFFVGLDETSVWSNVYHVIRAYVNAESVRHTTRTIGAHLSKAQNRVFYLAAFPPVL